MSYINYVSSYELWMQGAVKQDLRPQDTKIHETVYRQDKITDNVWGRDRGRKRREGRKCKVTVRAVWDASVDPERPGILHTGHFGFIPVCLDSWSQQTDLVVSWSSHYIMVDDGSKNRLLERISTSHHGRHLHGQTHLPIQMSWVWFVDAVALRTWFTSQRRITTPRFERQ